MRKIKVCYVISSLSNQGPPNVLYNIIQYMDYEHFDISIVTMVPEQKISRLQEFKQFPIKIVQMSPCKIQTPLAMFLTLRKTINQIKPDILHTHCPRSMFLVPMLSNRFKKVETVHIYPGEQQKVMYGWLKGSVVIALCHFFTLKMDLPIACSESVAQSYWDEKRVKMLAIPNGCSLPVWEKNMDEKRTLRKKLGLREELKYFIFIGRFSKEKHPEIIIKAFEQLGRTDVGIILLGSGDMYDELKLCETDKILLPGFRTNVYDYLKAADYYISASDVEGLANTLLESMTVGLPCVLSDIPSHLEVLSKCSQQIGFTFNNMSLESLLLAIEKTLLLDVDTVSPYIQEIFERHYTAKMMSERYQKEYQKLMS